MSVDIHFSSCDLSYETPQYFFDILDSEFGFTLDPCCMPETAKCDKFFTPFDDGLKQDWSSDIVFMNPPYGREISGWVEKAYIESLKGAVVVCLIPARPDTLYWHEFIFPHAAEIRFVKGRLKFVGCEHSAPFPSAVVVFRENN